MAELYEKDVRTVNEHLKNVYADGELNPDATIRKFRIVAREGARDIERLVDHYNLDAVLQVGYRVRSPRGAQFRQWATETLRTYLVKGFVLDDDRFKRGADAGYFEELLARIRDIRSSEKVFWRKVLDIYATSVDYDARAESSKQFFATIQNKLHWATHGHTAAELIALRADVGQPHMGLMTWAAAPQGGGPPNHRYSAHCGGAQPWGRGQSLFHRPEKATKSATLFKVMLRAKLAYSPRIHWANSY